MYIPLDKDNTSLSNCPNSLQANNQDNPSTNMTDSVDANSNHDHNTLLKPDGIFVLEHSKNNDFSTHPHYVETRKYGNVHFTFFE
jgi:16S rRNA G966 N2-methylase RsmD